MAITIRGIRIKTLTITPSPDEGDDKVSATYQLISSADKVLAEQTIGGYNGMKVGLSPASCKALDDFVKSYRSDINMTLGLESE